MPKSAGAFRTISEVATELDVPQHVLRFWESKFNQIKPLKRGGGRRYYRPEDVDLLRGIRHLLYGDGYTIKGVQKLLREQGVRHVIQTGRGASVARGPKGNGNGRDSRGETDVAGVPSSGAVPALDAEKRRRLETVLNDLEEVRAMIAARRKGR